MSSNVVYDARNRFNERSTPSQRVRNAVTAFGRLGTNPNAPTETAYTFGKRRLVAMAAPVIASLVILGSANVITNSNEDAEKYAAGIEACATDLVGHEVELPIDPGTGLQMVPEDVFPEVQACRFAGGDTEMARSKLQSGK
jgi:hypothetical protein